MSTEVHGDLRSVAPAADNWAYEEAFARNAGLVTASEQQRLRGSHVAIIGMGGVGGNHLMTLARLGVGRFTIADPDCFEVANFNRQYGATIENVAAPKASTMARLAMQINPEATIRILSKPIGADNIDSFLEDADLVIDGVDFFSIETRRLIFRRARERRLWTITAGPIGFSTAWLSFDPAGMSFDRYFDLHDDQELLDQLIAFAVGLTPRGTQSAYLDLSRVSVDERTGPSLGLACHLCSAVAASEAIKLLLNRGGVRPAPCFAQFDAYRCLLRRGRLIHGNRGWGQRFKRRFLKRYFAGRLVQ